MTKSEIESRRQQMVEMRKSGLTYREVAEHFGISVNAASHAINRPMYRTVELKEPKHQPAPNITIRDVMKIAEKIKAETGRYPSYGKLVAGIENGSVDPWRYIRKRRLI